MSDTYNPHEIEARWQALWVQQGAGHIDVEQTQRPFYNLMEFPYPSGEGLHVGHVFSFGGADTYGRFMRRRGYNLFQPMGFDAFGIHSENYALKVGAHPADLTPRSIARFRQQLRRLGAAFDWSREVDTTDPAYYKWTQWIFVQLFKAGLAYRAEANVNWCSSCKTVLANEQVVDGRCERCDTPMTQRTMSQWFFRITDYAERLLDFSAVDFSPAVIKRQQAWIGRSEGAEIEFQIAGDAKQYPAITIFTTHPDTIDGATFIALAPEHPLAAAIIAGGGVQAGDVQAYVTQAQGRLELDRQQSEPSGVFTGLEAINPANGRLVPIWVADYVLMGYGTGAIMGVPGQDERDARFAARYGLPTIPVDQQSFHSSFVARPKVRYRLRDWLVSRQRYWGPPIPIIYCDSCGTLPVPEDQLPVLLPPLEQFRPTGTGASPLATVEAFVQTTCPACGGPARRETDVSDNFLDSAWYFLRYTSTERDDVPWDNERVKRWLPIGMYTGGPEHATMHHLYARFISMALHDLGLSPAAEPFARLRLHGTITWEGRKMSKSRGNVVNPDEYIERFGADTTRMALVFLGPFDQDADFSEHGFVAIARFLRRVWECVTTDDQQPGVVIDSVVPGSDDRWSASDQAIRRVTEELEHQHFHTAIAALMEFTNLLREKRGHLDRAAFDEARRTLVLLLAPFAPHISEELWQRIGGTGSVHTQPWPEAVGEVSLVELPVQINGRFVDRVRIAADASDDVVREAALAQPKVSQVIGQRVIKRIVVVPGRIVNIVV